MKSKFAVRSKTIVEQLFIVEYYRHIDAKQLPNRDSNFFLIIIYIKSFIINIFFIQNNHLNQLYKLNHNTKYI